MKLKNTTDFQNVFLRRMVAWVCRELGISTRHVTLARFSTYSHSSRGTYYGGGRFRVMIGPASQFPVEAWNYRGAMVPRMEDRIEALVAVTAHELSHLDHFRVQRGQHHRHHEAWTVNQERKVLEVFRSNRIGLIAEWSESACAARPAPPSPIERRAAKARHDLARWQRRLKLAKTKVRKLTGRVKYYEKKAQT